MKVYIVCSDLGFFISVLATRKLAEQYLIEYPDAYIEEHEVVDKELQ